MTRLGRAFLAVVPPPTVLDAVAERIEPLTASNAPLRWPPRSQWHVTVQFLGPVDDAEALAAAVGSVVAPHAGFTHRLAGAGAFPSTRRGTVLWLGVEPAEPIATLAAVVGNATAPLGHLPEPRPYHPHLTVARAPRPRPLTRAVETIGPDPVGPDWTVTHLALVVSDTRPDGAVHTLWCQLPLDSA